MARKRVANEEVATAAEAATAAAVTAAAAVVVTVDKETENIVRYRTYTALECLGAT